MRTFLASSTALLLCACASGDDATPDIADESADLQTRDVWVHLDSNAGKYNATLTALNDATMRCPSGRVEKTCTAALLVLPSDCTQSCQDSLLLRAGETILRGRFAGIRFIVAEGLDTFAKDMGKHAVYLLSAASTCASDPCPGAATRRKLNGRSAADSVATLRFSRAIDPAFSADEPLGYDRTTAQEGLVASGRLLQGTFTVDRVWRRKTPKRSCDPLLTARAHAYRGSAPTLVEYRTQAEAENAANTPDTSRAWMVRTAESPSSVTFTSGLNDLWVERFSVSKNACGITTLAEH
jgi:hypothetical protein